MTGEGRDVEPLTAEDEQRLRAAVDRTSIDDDDWLAGTYTRSMVRRLLATLDAERRMADTEVAALREYVAAHPESRPDPGERVIAPIEVKALDYALRYSTIEHDYGCASITGYALGPCSCPAKGWRDMAHIAIKRLSEGLRKPSGDYKEERRG